MKKFLYFYEDADGTMCQKEAFVSDENGGSARELELEAVRVVIADNVCDADCGLYFTRNVVGDRMQTLFEGDFFTVDICYGYAYFEIFGCDEDEEAELEELYRNLSGK